ncbi:N-acetyl-gamma-glutamyl-phosphate reductase [Oceanobacillus piezotolerans]|uniref:N-acetyl-gamma-glutamyl-phosphate reductase n=1 Tax=Oceanobacillus piezotolerans TaxID=2448030 RepID=A0A498D5F5_9BACI|nr:N-acetyl-gamma-glutamyl-phosphate reductase [Oceanobacillus piezotolerans]RLL44948.1 N-acetyl-gamma-glutamyl-phosphate reductase [Oceanobacillus piezotolerans]
MKEVAIIGGTGYGAIELIRLLQAHEYMHLKKIISHSQHGQQITSSYPHLHGVIVEPMEKLDIESLIDEVDIVFLATPAGVAKEIVPLLQETSLQCIDLSGDLRLNNRKEYETWYGKEAAPQKTIDAAVYGLSEIYKEEVQQAKIITNPGCFPTSALLGLIPAVKHRIISLDSIVIDGKTGVSGAGGKASAMTHFSETNENVKPYKIGKHQHIPEIEQYLSEIANESITTTFTTHLIPMTRGLICTIYGKLTKPMSTKEIIDLYQSYYEGHPFIRIREEGIFPTTKEVAGSNYCDIGICVDERTNQLIIASAIDNLVKGASGQAIQNANLMNGWEEGHGLGFVPVYP